MTDNEIIKAMQCVIGNGVSCSECEYQKALPFPGCRRMCAENALDLINRQKAEIERMKNQNTLLLKKKCKDINTARKIIKSEALIEFAKRLKEKVKMYNSEGVDEGDLIDDLLTVGETVEIIDKLVKEMTEDKENV